MRPMLPLKRDYTNDRRPPHQIVHPLGIPQVARADLEVFLQAQGDDQLSVRKEPDFAAFPGRACAAPLSQWRGTLHRLQAVRGGVSGAGDHHRARAACGRRSEEHTPELQSLMRISYAVFCLKKKNTII